MSDVKCQMSNVNIEKSEMCWGGGLGEAGDLWQVVCIG
jgi:hypothetical protein